MENLNYQYVIAGILLVIAVVYVVRSIMKSVKNENCTDCGVPVPPKKKSHMKK
ncbi:MAG: FeoB-associated Cys-rich membrane protein [Bacteroidia bacterium]